jgi:hypothetical protein
MKRCEYCGNPSEDSAAFCAGCGQPLRSQEEALKPSSTRPSTIPCSGPVVCTRCGEPLPVEAGGLAAPARCGRCQAEFMVAVFPAIGRDAASGQRPELVVADGEASCFYHPVNRAVVPCESCGRFLCALCDVELDHHHCCPSCLEAGQHNGRIQGLERGRVRYDKVLWGLLVLPVLFCGLATPVTALGAMVLVLWKWRAPASLVVNTRFRRGFAAALAVVEMVAAALLYIGILSG